MQTMAPIHTETNNSCEKDRFSNLPESLIHHIFSFLHENYAIPLREVSKTFRQACLSSPHLNFASGTNYSHCNRKRINFGSFVDKLMSDRGDNNHIHCFKLQWHCPNECDYLKERSRFDSWIRKAVKCNVQELGLDLNCFGECSFSTMSLLSSCDSLRVLELDLKARPLELPPNVVLASLEVLSLKLAYLEGEFSLGEWTSSCCPSLKKLNLSHATGLNVFENHNIKELTFTDSRVGSRLSIVCDNLDLLSLRLGNNLGWGHEGGPVKIFAPKLEVLEWGGDPVDVADLCNFASLTSATIDITTARSYLWNGMFLLKSSVEQLKSVGSATVLCLSILLIEVWFNTGKVPLHFKNLHKLTIILDYSNWKDYLVPVISAFVSTMPSLKTLTIKTLHEKNYVYDSWDAEVIGSLKSKATAYLKKKTKRSHPALYPELKQVTMELPNMNMVKYFLETLDCLEELTISGYCIEDLRSTLLSWKHFHTASSTVRIKSFLKKPDDKEGILIRDNGGTVISYNLNNITG